MLWGAALRIALTDTDSPIRFEEIISPTAAGWWLSLSLACPPQALLAWWLIKKSNWKRGPLAGLWIRLGADVGQFLAIVTYHAVVAFTTPLHSTEARVYARYAVGACILFVGVLVLRDVWALALTERVAFRLRRRRNE